MGEPEVISIPSDEYELLISTWINASVLIEIYEQHNYIDKFTLERLSKLVKALQALRRTRRK